MKKVYYMHVERDYIEIKKTVVSIEKSFEVREGWIKEIHEKDPNSVSSHEQVFDENNNYVDNYLNDVFFDDIEQGNKFLTKLLHSRYEYNKKQNELCDTLAEKYIEYIV